MNAYQYSLIAGNEKLLIPKSYVEIITYRPYLYYTKNHKIYNSNNCAKKVKYENEAEAKNIVFYYNNLSSVGKKISYYQCFVCFGYHMTSKHNPDLYEELDHYVLLGEKKDCDLLSPL